LKPIAQQAKGKLRREKEFMTKVGHIGL